MDDFRDFARMLADASSAVIKPYFRSGVVIDEKGDGSPVTIADRKAEEVMREHIMREFPEHGILGEEFGTHQPDAPYQWILDPIDGTKNFIAGSFLFGTLIALTYLGKPVLGVIYHPLTDQFLIGTGDEAHCNGQRVTVRPCARVEDAMILASTHWGVADHKPFEPFETLTRRAARYRTWGDCHGYFLVGTGYADVMLDPDMKPWDLLPVIPIIRGAGGTITDWHGNDPVVGTSIVATGGSIHDAVITALNQ